MNISRLGPVILVDDEPDLLLGSRGLLKSVGVHAVTTLDDSRKLLPLLEDVQASVIVLDLFMPHLTGMELLPQLVERHPETPVIIMTAAQEIDNAVACMKDGAFDYLVKPVEENRFTSSIRKALEMLAMRQEIGSFRKALFADRPENESAFAHIVTRNSKMIAIFRYLEAVRVSSEPVLITGETGVGKELFATAIHALSERKGQLVKVNAAGLDDAMFSDALFGHRKGAFTGAESHREGLIAQAAGGTLFLDEIGDLAPASQVKLLRLVQERQYYPLGADTPRNTDARLVLATNRDLRPMAEAGEFRKDLYFRLSAHQAEIPPLRKRREDLPLLVNYFLEMAAVEMGKTVPTPPPELYDLLGAHHFPGNVRELRALLFDAVARHTAGVMSLEPIREAILKEQAHQASPPRPDREGGSANPFALLPDPLPCVDETEALLIQEAMKRAGGNQGVAAGMLRISRQTLNRKLKRTKG